MVAATPTEPATAGAAALVALVDEVAPDLRRTAWLPAEAPAPRGHDQPRSKTGGLPLLLAGEAWPRCGYCGRPMRLLLQLDTAQLPPDGDFGEGLVQLFYCADDNDDAGRPNRNHLARRLPPDADLAEPPMDLTNGSFVERPSSSVIATRNGSACHGRARSGASS
jgi:hypothetical protein